MGNDTPLERMLNTGTAAAEECGDIPLMAALVWKTPDGAIESQVCRNLDTEDLIGIDMDILPNRVRQAIRETLVDYFGVEEEE